MIKKIIALVILIISFGNISNAQPPIPIETDTLSPSVTSALITSFTQTTATMGGVVTADGGAPVLERGVVYSTTNTLPTIANTKQLIGTGTGTFSANVSGLIGGSLYYVRAYAVNIVGVSYGATRTFTTLPVAPTVTTAEILAITTSGATVGGNVLLEGGVAVTDRGAVYSTTNTLPTITDTKLNIGAGAGIFSQSLTGLTANTVYYLRAYATNSIGTSYGSVFVFIPGGPTLSTADASSISQTSVSLGGNVTDIGNSAVTDRGIVYVTGNTEPAITNNKTIIGNGLGAYSQTVAGLLQGTLYSYRAYAINSAGTSFGQTKTFTTQTSVSSISIVGPSLTNAVAGSFTVNFAQPITGLTAANFSLTTTGLTNSLISAVTGSGTTWNVVVATGSGAGTIVLNLANANGISPGIGNALPFVGATLNIDRVLPTVSSIQLVNPTPSNASSLQYTVVFSKPVTGVDITDFVLVSPTITDAAVTSVTGSGTTYTVTINTGTTNGTIRLDVLGSAASTTIFDVVGNKLTANFTTGPIYTMVDKNTAPSISVQPIAAAICSGANTSFTIAASSFVPFTYQWQVNSGAGFVNINNVAPYANATTPTLTITGATTSLNGFQYRCVTSNNSASTNSSAVVLTVNPLPVIAPITGSQQVCFQSTTPFTSATTGGVWSSNNNTAATVNATTGIVTGLQSGTATISYTVTNASSGCASTTVTKDINVNALPLITASASPAVVFKGQNTQLNVSAVGNIANFVWSSSGGTLTTNPASTTVRVIQNTTYTVTATSTAGCIATANVVVTTKEDNYVETVNVFTPNGDGINDRFVIKNLDLYPNNKLQVFDRTGKVVYEQNNYANTWDGYVNGKLLTKDTYFYVLTVNGLIVKKVTITLVR